MIPNQLEAIPNMTATHGIGSITSSGQHTALVSVEPAEQSLGLSGAASGAESIPCLATKGRRNTIGNSLTARELEIVRLVAKGWKNRAIAKRLGITELVAKNYLRPIYDKLGMHNRVELALWYVRHIENQSD